MEHNFLYRINSLENHIKIKFNKLAYVYTLNYLLFIHNLQNALKINLLRVVEKVGLKNVNIFVKSDS